MQTANITSDGTAAGTKVVVDGEALKSVVRIEIAPIEPGAPIIARVTQVFRAELDIKVSLPPGE